MSNYVRMRISRFRIFVPGKSHFLYGAVGTYVSRPAEDTQLPEQLPLALATAAAWRFWRFVDLFQGRPTSYIAERFLIVF